MNVMVVVESVVKLFIDQLFEELRLDNCGLKWEEMQDLKIFYDKILRFSMRKPLVRLWEDLL